jgi:hypothetical protein
MPKYLDMLKAKYGVEQFNNKQSLEDYMIERSKIAMRDLTSKYPETDFSKWRNIDKQSWLRFVLQGDDEYIAFILKHKLL